MIRAGSRPAPALGAPAFELRFRNGCVTGIVATAEFDCFLGYGVCLERCQRGRWYELPAVASAEPDCWSLA